MMERELNGTKTQDPIYIPEKYTFPQTQTGLAASRTPVKLKPDTSTYSSNSNYEIRMDLPTNALYDFRDGYITFTLNYQTPAYPGSPAAGWTYFRTPKYIWNIFQRIQILMNGREVEYVDFWGNIESLCTETFNTDLVNECWSRPFASGNAQRRNLTWLGQTAAFGAGQNVPVNNNISFSMPILSAFLTEQLFPLDVLQNNRIQVSFFLDDPANYLETDIGGTAGPSGIIAQVTNFQIHCERVRLDPMYTQQLNQTVISRGFNVGYKSWIRYLNAIPGGSASQILINAKFVSIHNIFNFIHPQIYAKPSTQINDKRVTYPYYIQEVANPAGGFNIGMQTNWKTVQLTLNGVTYPDEPIDLMQGGNIEPYQSYADYENKYNANNENLLDLAITNDQFATDHFLQIDQFDPYPQVKDVDNLFNTLNSLALVKQLAFNNAGIQYWSAGNSLTAVAANLHSWVEFYVRLRIAVGGRVEVIR